MKSKEVWDEGNKVSSRLMTAVGVIVTLVQVALSMFIEGNLQLLIPILLMVVLLVATIPATEIHLKKRFDKDGNRKDLPE